MSPPEYQESLIEGGASSPAPAIDPRRLMRELKAFHDPSPARSLRELAVTLVPFLALFASIAFAV
ncbi:MAG: hypothetical protein V2I43_17125, partial [Parvularcula sp.]|nr:hypothetical protein [Parvularcula sp.]